jgi:hypothetical protein
MTAAATIADQLEGLDGRSWAQLLRAVRALPDSTGEVRTVLARPTSELTSVPGRRALSAALAGAPELLELLRGDGSLPVDVHAALSSGTTLKGPKSGPESDRDRAPDSDAERATERLRVLRRTLEDERRRREGSEARAQVAEVRVEELSALRDDLEVRIAALTEELAGMQDTLRQVTARVERRSGTRIAELERELTAARSERERMRRDHERTHAELAATRVELASLRDQTMVPGAQESARATPDPRPLVLPSAVEPGTTAAARWLADRARILLIDGYNVVLTLRPGQTLEEQRRWLVERLRPLVPRGGAVPVVVWDGARGGARLRDTGGVEVRFTAAGTTADDEIVFAVAATADPVLVVTDDAELQERVAAEGGNVVGIMHLLGIVEG